jgi:hypothetical protein
VRLLAAVPVVAAVAAYHGILGNYFRGDDFRHLWEIADWGFAPFVLRPHGGHLLLVPNLLFFAQHRLFGLDPRPYFALVLVTHVVNAALLHRLLRAVGTRPTVALLGATLWAVLPVHGGPLGWYSVYGQVLSTMALLWVLGDLCRAAAGALVPGHARAAGWALALLAGATCFGTGVAVALVAPLVAFLLLPPSPGRRRAVGWLAALGVATPVLYGACVALYGRLVGGSAGLVPLPANGARALPGILRAAIALPAHGVACTVLPSVCDGVDRWSACTALAALVGIGVVATCATSPARERRRLVAWLLLAGAIYGIIALARAPVAWLFRETVPQLAATDRYHYTGTAIVVLVVCAVVDRLWRAVSRPAWLVPAVLTGWATVAAVLVVRAPDIDHHALERTQTARALARFDALIDAAPPGADVYIPNRDFPPAGWSARGRRTFPGWAGLFVIAEPDDVVRGRRVYFRDPDPAVVALFRAWPGRRTARLLVRPDEARPGVPLGSSAQR